MMKFQVKCDINLACRVVLQEHLEKLEIPYEITGVGEVQLKGPIPSDKFVEFEASIKRYGIEIIDNPKFAIVQKIKDIIVEMVYKKEKLPDSKISTYLANQMNLSYGYLSKIFSEVTYTSIENFMIIQRIERAKQLIIEENLTCTEVAWKMNYSSVAHLSYQFKKTTGLTPTVFQRIIERRNNMSSTPENVNQESYGK